MKKTYRNLTVWAIVVMCLLMIPKIAMRHSDEVNWDTMDFIIMGSVLFGIGLIYELISKRSEVTIYRIALAVALIGAFLLFWVNGAVGIIGNEDQTPNFLYGIVFLIGLGGAFLSRLGAKGMSVTLFIAAGAQVLIPAIALIIWPPSVLSWSSGVLGVFMLSCFFGALFLISAMLFRRASQL